MTAPADTAAPIDQSRTGGVVLTYNAGDKTMRADDQDAPSVTIGKDR